jgi:hypothetical protein
MQNMTPFVRNLLARAGTALPDSAWSAALELYGDSVLEQGAPDSIVRTRLENQAKLPAAAAKAIARTTTLPWAASKLASDRRVGVQQALSTYWLPTADMVDALVKARCDNDVATRIAEVALPSATRARLWTRMRPLDALADAARDPNAVTSSQVLELLLRDDFDRINAVPHAAHVIEHHHEVVDELVQHSPWPVRVALASTRVGIAHAEQLLSTGARTRGDQYVWFAIADHPATPLDIAHRAIEQLDDAGSELHLRVPVQPDAVPRVLGIDDWDEHAARVVVLRSNDSDAVQRFFHLQEVYNATRLDPAIQRAAAFRIFDTIGWAVDTYRPLFESYKERLSTDLPNWASDALERRGSNTAPGPRPVGPLAEPRRRTATNKPTNDPPERLVLEASQWHINCAPRPAEVLATATYLTRHLGTDPVAWRLAFELHRGFSSTLEDLMALVDATA